MNKVSIKKILNQEIEVKNNLKDLFCYLSVAILPIFLFSYRFLPKVKKINIFGFDWSFNGFSSSYSFLFALLSKVAPLLFILIFYLDPQPIRLFRKTVNFKTFLIPTALLYCYQLLFIIAPFDKIDEGFYTELIGWSSASIMTLCVVFSKELLDLVNSFFTIVYIKITSQSDKLKFKVRELISLVMSIRNSKSHSINKEEFDKNMWDTFKKITK